MEARIARTGIIIVSVLVVLVIAALWQVHRERVQTDREVHREQVHINKVAKCMVFTGQSSDWCELRVG